MMIALAVICLYLAVTFFGFKTLFDTRIIKPVKFISNPSFDISTDVAVPETSLAMMRGTGDIGDNDIQVGDLVKMSTSTSSSDFNGCPSSSSNVDYYGRVMGSEEDKAKIQWTYWKLNNQGEDKCPSNSDFSSDCNCCGKENCHIRETKNQNEIALLFGNSESNCDGCPVKSSVKIDMLEKVDHIDNTLTHRNSNTDDDYWSGENWKLPDTYRSTPASTSSSD